MLSVQSLQTLRGAAAAYFCCYSRVVGALSLACSQSYAFSRAQAVPTCCARVEQPSFWLGSPQLSRFAWIAQLCSAFNDDV